MFVWLTAQGGYFLLWLSFGLGHSLLAGDRSPLRVVGRWQRLSYNLLAAVHLVVVIVGGHLLLDTRAFVWSPVMLWVRTAAVGIGLLVLILSLRQYDLRRFAGFRQIGDRDGEAETPEPLHISGLNRYVRHPLYVGSILLLLGIADSEFGLATALWASVYFIVGSRVEERRLVAMYGADYERYRRKTPAFIPRLVRRRVGYR
ncbi:MAG: S-isoprenylcysteine methyltransferase [Rhodospirillaceae bacterium]|nr:S-isoprenylcysteine methyltransferase [Rhodospirillaceae bacterium]